MVDNDDTGDRRGYRVGLRYLIRNNVFVVAYQVFLSGKNVDASKWSMVGTAGQFPGINYIKESVHGLEVTSLVGNTMPPGMQSRIDGIMHQVGGSWFNVDGLVYAVTNKLTAAPRFGVIHDLADTRPSNNVTINYEVP